MVCSPSYRLNYLWVSAEVEFSAPRKVLKESHKEARVMHFSKLNIPHRQSLLSPWHK